MTITPDIEIIKDFDPEAEIAREVLRDDLGDMFSAEDEARLARAWEATHSRPLKLEAESWTEFKKRKASFTPAKAPKSYFMDTDSAQQALRRLRSKQELTEGDRNEIHALEQLLDVPLTDFAKAKPKEEDAAEESVKRYERIAKCPTYAERIALVSKEKDLGTLSLVDSRDPREEVRQAAQERIILVSLGKE